MQRTRPGNWKHYTATFIPHVILSDGFKFYLRQVEAEMPEAESNH
jgi:hypothetical protein